MLEGGAVIAHDDADGFVVFLDEGKGGIGLMRGGALDGEVAIGISRRSLNAVKVRSVFCNEVGN